MPDLSPAAREALRRAGPHVVAPGMRLLTTDERYRNPMARCSDNEHMIRHYVTEMGGYPDLSDGTTYRECVHRLACKVAGREVENATWREGHPVGWVLHWNIAGIQGYERRFDVKGGRVEALALALGEAFGGEDG